ncbi:MAG: WYL domain-containing protein [Gemmatimonadetes bacterium]|nr:WYL domain-containing protein [Gemmatimonadota bacterium]
MAEGSGTADRLERLLYVLPAASRKQGASLEELADALGTTGKRIMQDLEQVTARAYYHPGGWPDDVSILIEPDRVRVMHAAGFERPIRLSPRETLCLALALRGTAAASHVRHGARRMALLQRAEKYLGSSPDGGDGAWTPDPLHAGDHAPDPEGIRETLLAAARDRHACAIVYAKASADDMDARVIHPYAILHAEGAWYVVAWCAVKEGMRVFRMDRILAADETDASFDVPADFDAADYVSGNHVYRAPEDVEVRVRYSPRIARWVRERAEAGVAEWEEEGDGSLVVRHRVADPHWVVNHALTYGPDAEILEPEDLRAMVREVVGRMGG